MKASFRAFLNKLETPRRTESEYATLLPAVPRCHHNSYGFIQHGLLQITAFTSRLASEHNMLAQQQKA